MMNTDERTRRLNETWLQRLLTWTDGQTDMMKLLAACLMVVDHANRALHLHATGMMLVGRGAFPLFALAWGRNLARHRDIRQATLNRLWVFACLAQIPYLSLGNAWWQGNILFAFAVAGQGLHLCLLRTGSVGLLALAVVLLWLPFSATSYGLPGVALLMVSCLLYRAENAERQASCFLAWAALVLVMNLDISLTAGITGLLVSIPVVGTVTRGRAIPAGRFLPRGVFMLFYTGHLAALGLLALLLAGPVNGGIT
ncbi:type-F conjugative transfer system pilin acetylase TraX [Cedecea sp. NFIX57]|uniref:type-F conjugative transfer system pilin acetylase TraX n=1 Tax=Cedecea sp. NFIX57 TaxID=1566286 RepID=UPI000A0AD025|nr:type-F conjugative transfer system pilin acetylase TraX [Cedecea sp. NFIX57]SMG59901.1 type-F conjugative transfer system pilin acetylase TraX [Cedecea sp. NFIX57]